MLKPLLLAAFFATGFSAGAAEAATVTTTTTVQTPAAQTVQYQPPRHGPAHGPGWHHRPAPRRVCTPVYKTVRVHGRHGWTTKRVIVSHRCHWVRGGYRW